MTDRDELAERLTRFYQDVRAEVPAMPPGWRPESRRRPAALLSAGASVALVMLAVPVAIAIRTVREDVHHGPPAPASHAGTVAGPLVRDLGSFAGGGAWVLNGTGLYRTDDWGAHWQTVSPSVPNPGAALLAATFTDSRHGWAAAAVPEGNLRVTVYRTADGGRTWTTSLVPATFSDGFGESHLSFSDAAHGWLVVDLPHGGAAGMAAVFATADGGGSWTRLANAPTVSGVRFQGLSAGWGVDVAGRLYRTTDGGRTWEDAPLPVPVDLPAFFGSEGVALGSGPSGLVVMVTHDSGSTWSARPGPAGIDASHYGSPLMIPLAVINPRQWVIFPGPAFYQSADAGGTWQALRPNRAWPVAAAALFTSPSDGWIVVTQGTCQGVKSDCVQQSMLLATHDGGHTLSQVTAPGTAG